MTKNIFNLAIPISTLCIVDDKSCDSWHQPIERKWSVETGHVNVSDLLYLLYSLWIGYSGYRHWPTYSAT